MPKMTKFEFEMMKLAFEHYSAQIDYRRELIYRIFSWSSSFFLGALISIIVLLPKTSIGLSPIIRLLISLSVFLFALFIMAYQLVNRLTEYKYWEVVFELEQKIGFKQLGINTKSIMLSAELSFLPRWAQWAFALGPRGFNTLTFAFAILDIAVLWII